MRFPAVQPHMPHTPVPQALTRERPSESSCAWMVAGGYSGTPLSLSSRKRWLAGSANPAASRLRAATTRSCEPQAT